MGNGSDAVSRNLIWHPGGKWTLEEKLLSQVSEFEVGQLGGKLKSIHSMSVLETIVQMADETMHFV